MLEIPLGKLKFNEEVEFVFPNRPCCNCGTTSGIQIVEQDTRRSTYMIGGGTEITFRLPLPFCPDCKPSAKRRPKNIVHRILGFLIAFGLTSLLLMIIDDLVLGSMVLSKNLLPISLSVAAAATLTWVALGRPKGRQSSHFQPVRIPVLKREFLSGTVTGIGFAFTNKDYARLFTVANRKAIEKKVVSVKLI
jgi:hypothetical protein